MKNQKEINLEGVILEMKIPDSILEKFLHIAQENSDFVGEKIILNGYILKTEIKKVAITIQEGYKLYSAKLKKNMHTGEWKFDGEVYRWENVEPFLQHENYPG